MKVMLVIIFSLVLVSCRYTYPLVSNNKLQTESGKPVLVPTYDEVLAQDQTAKAFDEVKGIEIPPVNIWQERIIGTSFAIGVGLIIIGILLFLFGQQPIKGVLLGISGVACIVTFMILSALSVWIQEHTGLIAAIFCTILIIGLAYGVWYGRGLLKSLIHSFEAQKFSSWSLKTEDTVKKAQGKFQPVISKLRKKLI